MQDLDLGNRAAIPLAFENTKTHSETTERKTKTTERKTNKKRERERIKQHSIQTQYIFKIRFSFHKSLVHLNIYRCYGLTTLVLQTALTVLSFCGCQYCFFMFFGLFFLKMKRKSSAFLWDGSNHSPNPQDSKPFWTSVNSPQPSSPAILLPFGKTAPKYFFPFQTQTDGVSGEKQKRKTASIVQA